MDLITFGCLLQLSIADLELRAWDSVSNLMAHPRHYTYWWKSLLSALFNGE